MIQVPRTQPRAIKNPHTNQTSIAFAVMIVNIIVSFDTSWRNSCQRANGQNVPPISGAIFAGGALGAVVGAFAGGCVGVVASALVGMVGCGARAEAMIDIEAAHSERCQFIKYRAGPRLSEAALLRAMFDVGYFPPNTPRNFN